MVFKLLRKYPMYRGHKQHSHRKYGHLIAIVTVQANVSTKRMITMKGNIIKHLPALEDHN